MLNLRSSTKYIDLKILCSQTNYNKNIFIYIDLNIFQIHIIIM